MKKMFDVFELVMSFGGNVLEENAVFHGTHEECENFIKGANHVGAFSVFVYEVRPS